MIKLSDLQWNLEAVKAMDFDKFKLIVEHYAENGKVDKCSDSEIRKFYENLTGVKVESNKEKK